MKRNALSLLVVAGIGLAIGVMSLADLAPLPGPKPGPRPISPARLVGKITVAPDEKGVLTVLPKGKTDEKDAVKVETDDKTAVTIDGKESKVCDLKEGLFVFISPEKGIAKRIIASTKELAEMGSGNGR